MGAGSRPRAESAGPDVIAPITRAACAHLLLSGQLAAFKEDLEHVLTSVPWPNSRRQARRRVAEGRRAPEVRVPTPARLGKLASASFARGAWDL